MPSKVNFLFGVPMFIGCCAILWIYWDRLKKPSKPRGLRKKKIFIPADCWLCVFDLLPAYQLGHGIALISHRFDFYVDEHFKTRKWTLKHIRIRRKIGKNGTKEMAITNLDGKPMPIPPVQLPRKVSGFKCITISYIDRNSIAFLHRFASLFTKCPINLTITTGSSDRIAEFVLRNIWPMLGKKICGMKLSAATFRHVRQFVPSILNDLPSLRVVSFILDDLFPIFPFDHNAMALDGQSVVNWLFTARPDNMPKMLKCALECGGRHAKSKIEAFKAAFINASSPANFIVHIWFRSSFAVSDLPFVVTNEFTHEQLTLERINNNNRFLLIRCPIVRDADKWAKWEEEAFNWRICDQWNRIDIEIHDYDDIGDGLLSATPGPSDQQQK